MKIIWVLPILFVACQQSNFSVGECIQKPDEIYRYKIIEIKENTAKLESLNGGPQQSASLDDSMWTLTSCE